MHRDLLGIARQRNVAVLIGLWEPTIFSNPPIEIKGEVSAAIMKRSRKTIDPNLTSAILTLFACIGLPCASMNLEPPTTDQTIQAELRASLDPASQAMLASQSGPLAAKIFTNLPTSPEFTFEPCHFRVLLLRRLRLPTCRCRQQLEPLGDHRAACPRSGALRTRASGMERKGSSPHLPRGWRDSQHQRPCQGLKHPHHTARRQTHRGDCEWPPTVERLSASS